MTVSGDTHGILGIAGEYGLGRIEERVNLTE